MLVPDVLVGGTSSRFKVVVRARLCRYRHREALELASRLVCFRVVTGGGGEALPGVSVAAQRGLGALQQRHGTAARRTRRH